MKKREILITIVLTTNLITANSLTGFFGYQDPIETPEENRTKKPPTDYKMDKLVKQAVTDPLSMTAEQFKKAQAYAKDKAVMQQTEKSIKDWMILNNFTVSRADSFQRKQKIVLFKNPELYQGADLAKSGYVQKAQNRAAAEHQKKLIEGLTDKVAIFAFFGEESGNIKASMDRVLWFISQDYKNMTIIRVDTLKNNKLFREIGEKSTPSIWMAYRNRYNKPQWYRIAGGVATKNEILDNIEFVYENVIKADNEGD